MRFLSSLILSIPLTLSTGWETLSFRKIPPNQISYQQDGLHISVKSSSSPLIYKFENTKNIQRVVAEGYLRGKINIPDFRQQGLKGHDDMPLRLGLVLEGAQTLSWGEKLIAAEWIKKMHSMAPKEKGLDHVLFLEVASTAQLIGIKRDHYLSKLLKEEIVASVNEQGYFKIDKSFDLPQKVLGLWLSTSGDHGPSTFDLHIQKIELTTVN